jgi:hypothetical protein
VYWPFLKRRRRDECNAQDVVDREREKIVLKEREDDADRRLSELLFNVEQVIAPSSKKESS